jgi:hypothetical protein
MLSLECITEDPDRSKLRLADRLYVHFHSALGFDTPVLADTLDSFVRVSRRVVLSHYVNILSMYGDESQPKGMLRSSVPINVYDARL